MDTISTLILSEPVKLIMKQTLPTHQSQMSQIKVFSINDNQYEDVITCSNLVNFMNKDDEDIVGSFIQALHIMVHSHTE
jgi:hypothetical protein